MEVNRGDGKVGNKFPCMCRIGQLHRLEYDESSNNKLDIVSPVDQIDAGQSHLILTELYPIIIARTKPS